MKFGYYTDNEIPKSAPLTDYKVNSYGYRCPE